MTKLIFSLLILFVAAINLKSQTTLTSANNPSIGDLQYQVSADTIGISQGNAGANQVWNFQNLTRRDSTVIMWIDPATTPYGSNFPQSNICTHDSSYDYFKTSTTQMEYVGSKSEVTILNYSNFEMINSYPFTFNSTANDNYSGVINSNGDVIIRTGSTNIVGDAYGTISLPFGTYTNALRTKSTVNVKDSSTMYQMAINTSYTIYAWFAPGKKFSVFSIMYYSFTIPGYGTFNRKVVYYNPSSTPLGILPIGSSVPQNFNLLQNYPNPFNPATKIEFDIPRASFTRLTIFDILGREIASPVNEQLIPGHYEINFEASSYPSGVYFYRLSTDGFVKTKRMMLIK